jgi:glyoxylase I family protein
MELKGIDHPAIAADNLDALADWYCNVLGYNKFFKNEERRVWIIQAPDGTFIEMMQNDGTDRPKRTILAPGMSHLALRVSDLSKAIAHLDQHSVRWISDVVPAIGGGHLRTFEDLEGNVLQVVQR